MQAATILEKRKKKGRSAAGGFSVPPSKSLDDVKPAAQKQAVDTNGAETQAQEEQQPSPAQEPPADGRAQ